MSRMKLQKKGETLLLYSEKEAPHFHLALAPQMILPAPTVCLISVYAMDTYLYEIQSIEVKQQSYFFLP